MNINHKIGLIIASVLIGLISTLLYLRNGILQRAEWVAFYVAIGLVTGIAFWVVTDSSATVEIRTLGIKLAGGAAIGAAFIILAHQFTPGPELRLFEIPEKIRKSHTVLAVDNSPNINVRLIKDVSWKWIIVRFNEGVSEGQVTLEYYPQGLESQQKCYTVSRIGDFTNC